MLSRNGRNYFSLRETAQILDVKLATVRVWCQRGKINAFRMSLGRGVQKDWAISEEEIQRVIMHGLLEPAEEEVPEPEPVAAQPEPGPILGRTTETVRQLGSNSVDPSSFYSPAEAAMILGLTKRGVISRIHKGQMKAEKKQWRLGNSKDWAIPGEEIIRVRDLVFQPKKPQEKPIEVVEDEPELAADPEPAQAPGERRYFTVKEAALRLGKDPYTVREWCREGRIKATKRETACGPYQEWSVSKDEIMRYLDHGLLPTKQPDKPKALPMGPMNAFRPSRSSNPKDWTSTYLVRPSVRG